MKTNTFNPSAYLTLTNCGGISIELNNSGDSVRYQWFNGKPSKWCKIYFASSGRPYFRIYNKRYYLDDFLRINF